MQKYRLIDVALAALLLLHHGILRSVAFVLSGHSSSTSTIGRGIHDKNNKLIKYPAPKSKTPLYDAAAADPSSRQIVSGGSQEGSTSGGTATMSNEIFNLIKSIVGAGVLSLPAGIAAFANAPSAVIPAAILIALIGGISGYCFSLIGRVCAMEDASSYMNAWEKTVGSKTSIIPVAACTLSTLSAALAYSMILADTFKILLASVGINLSRSNTLFGVTGFILLPLCLLKNLSSLAPFSLLGIIGMAYTALAMTLRYIGGGYKLPDGKFLSGVAANLQPSFGTIGAQGVFRPSSLILISSLSTAFMAHFNAPKFYNELKNNTMKRYNTVVATSFAASIAIFSTMAAMGFLTFGQAASGFILNNYSVADRLIGLSRIAVAMSLVFS
jgi:amino acid permease